MAHGPKTPVRGHPLKVLVPQMLNNFQHARLAPPTFYCILCIFWGHHSWAVKEKAGVWAHHPRNIHPRGGKSSPASGPGTSRSLAEPGTCGEQVWRNRRTSWILFQGVNQNGAPTKRKRRSMFIVYVCIYVFDVYGFRFFSYHRSWLVHWVRHLCLGKLNVCSGVMGVGSNGSGCWVLIQEAGVGFCFCFWSRMFFINKIHTTLKGMSTSGLTSISMLQNGKGTPPLTWLASLICARSCSIIYCKNKKHLELPGCSDRKWVSCVVSSLFNSRNSTRESCRWGLYSVSSSTERD